MSQWSQPTRIDWPGIYTAQHNALTASQVNELFARGRQWQLGALLAAGGVVVFPHAAVLDCGYQVAAAVNAALDSGAAKVLVVSVLHAWTEEMAAARQQLAQGEDLTHHPLHGIQGPQIAGSREEWRRDHALISWRYFWEAACARRGLAQSAQPEVREVYPFLAGDDPATLPHYDEVARWAEDAIIVSTADPFHHGIGYGDDDAVARAPHDSGLELARASIATGNSYLAQGDYAAYLQHCVAARNDARDAGPLFRHLRGPMRPELLDLTASDMTTFYGAPPPTWVAAALVAWHPTR